MKNSSTLSLRDSRSSDDSINAESQHRVRKKLNGPDFVSVSISCLMRYPAGNVCYRCVILRISANHTRSFDCRDRYFYAPLKVENENNTSCTYRQRSGTVVHQHNSTTNSRRKRGDLSLDLQLQSHHRRAVGWRLSGTRVENDVTVDGRATSSALKGF
jgi:hypothetical protein